MARDLEKKRISRVMSFQKVGKVSGSSPSGTNGHDPSAIVALVSIFVKVRSLSFIALTSLFGH